MQHDLDRRLRDARAALAGPGSEREERAVARALAGRRKRRGTGAALVAASVLASLTISLAAVAAGGAPRGTTASEAAVRVVDRTFSCMPGHAYDGTGAREFSLAVTKRTRSTATSHWEPAGVVLDGGSPSSARSKFLIVRGHESRYALSSPGLSGPGLGGVYVNTKSCVPSRKTVALSRLGLPGPAVRYQTGTGCSVRGRILVRVRAGLTRTARWREITEVFSGVQRNVTETAVAVRAERTGRPLVFAQARPTSVVLWRADACR